MTKKNYDWLKAPAVTRRQFLAAMGIGGASLFLPSLSGGARANNGADNGPPKRLVLMLTAHGTVYPNWRMRRPGLNDEQDWEFDFDDPDPNSFSEILRPLHPMRDKLLVLDGLALASAQGDIRYNEHALGHVHALTGSSALQISGDRISATAPSVDQIIAGHIRRADRLSSLEFSVGGNPYIDYVYAGENSPIPMEANPLHAFSRVFPSDDGSGTLSNAARLRRSQASMLDLVHDEYDMMATRLSGEDRVKLEAHRDLVRDLERRIDALSNIVCDRPDMPDLASWGDPMWYTSRADAFTRLAASVLACDLTRVVTINFNQLPNVLIDAPPGDVHADFAHRSDDDPFAIQMMTNYGRVHAQHFKDICDALDAVPEANGTLLDNTLVVWCGELATGTHRMSVWPVVMAGGGAFRMGRYVRWKPDTPNPGWGSSVVTGIPHNRFLVSLCKALGADVDHVGLHDLRSAFDNSPIDVTSPLDRLT